MKHGEMKESDMKKMKARDAMMKPMSDKEMKAKHESKHGAPKKRVKGRKK